MKPHKLRLAVILLLADLAAPALAADCGSGIGPCSCGDTVAASTKLTPRDPVTRYQCPGTGLLIGIGGITLNCGNRWITGTPEDDFQVGIDLNGQTDVEVLRCKLRDFHTGIDLGYWTETTTTAVERSRFKDLRYGIAGADFSSIKIDRNRFDGVTSPIDLDEAYQVEITHNRMERSAVGVLLKIVDESTVSNNLIRRGSSTAIKIQESGGTVVERNRLIKNGGVGIRLTLSYGNKVLRNKVLRNLQTGIVVEGEGNDTIVEYNTSSQNRRGILYRDELEGGAIINNHGARNREGGLIVTGSENIMVQGNRFNRNGGPGICADAAIDGGGNVGKRNAAADVDLEGPCP